jgi:DNA anti-recombination protein RmuC
MQDTKRLDERVRALQKHFEQGSGDLREIVISTEKIVRQAGRIEAVDLSPSETSQISN